MSRADNGADNGADAVPSAGPLAGVHIVEFDGLGPVPLAGRMLHLAGATVTRIARPSRAGEAAAGGLRADSTAGRLAGSAGDALLHAGKAVVTLDLKTPAGVAAALDRLTGADALIEGHRPGVMERLGLGPAICHARHPRLVYARMTGWGQAGPLAQAAGHDLNYVALTGLLSLSARPGQPPIVPPTVIGDAGGALGLAFGVVCGVLEARQCGRGRVVDAAIVDIVAMMGGLVHWLNAGGSLAGTQPSPFHDSPFYEVYECADGRHVTVAALEPAFYAELLRRLGLDDVDPAAQYDRAQWPALKARFAALFRTLPRDAWCERLEGSDACFAPVLSLAEAVGHPHNVARGVFTRTPSGAIQAGAAPRFLGDTDG